MNDSRTEAGGRPASPKAFNIQSKPNQCIMKNEGPNVFGRMPAVPKFLASLLLMPEIEPMAELVILFSWAYAESVKDIRILFRGGKVPLVKSDASWNTPFSQLLTYRSHLNSYHSPESGWSYREYLGALLFCHGAGHAVMGLMDVMESDIRRTAGNAGFRIDGLIDGMEAEISVTSRFGGSYRIKRIYAYE